MKRSITIALLCLALTSVHAVEIVRWDRVPLAVSLVVDQERVIFVDRPVRVGMPALLGEQLRVQSAGGALYLRAHVPFQLTRIQLQDSETGALILLDVSAREPKPDEVPLEPLRIVESDEVAPRNSEPPKVRDKEQHRFSVASRATPVPVVLTRYAAQSLYAPLRTVEPVTGIARAPLPKDLALETLLPAHPIQARALAAWRLEDFWLTAVALKNVSSVWIELDPRSLQGDFTTATFQHPNLGPKETPEDTTVLYLVSRGHGIADSLLPRIQAVDPASNLSRKHRPEGGRDEK